MTKFSKLARSEANSREEIRLASEQRTIEFWNSLWRLWDDIVAEVGDEEGKYAIQNHHWEAPYFDGSYPSLDLEPIAEDMLGLIDDVYDSVDSPDLFLEALEEVEDNISLYPEWMGVEYGEAFELERNATLCALKWLWLGVQDEPHSGVFLLEKVSDIENSDQMLYLNRNASVEFFVKLPDDICRMIHTYLKEEEHELDLSNVHSIWHQINHNYELRFDLSKYLESCRRHLADNWHYGRPLIDDALNRNKVMESEILLEKTFATLPGEQKKSKWHPETTLLIDQGYFIKKQDREEISTLLHTWNEVAVKLGNSKRSAAAELQSVIIRSPQDCDAVINAYKRLVNSKVKKTLDALFDCWKTEMAEAKLPS